MGERPIGILSYIYRLYARLHKIDIDDWEATTRVEWDTAVQGNSALQSALKRMLFDEAAVNDQQIAAEIFIDIKKFYDYISRFRLIWHAVVTGFPNLVLIVGTYVHLAPRQVRVRKVFFQANLTYLRGGGGG